ncbi:hypothetical protein L596_010914 [Steinernema carpocapsae]|uniref:Ig-like domain-containing protein n=1 Tax=Steinernema carpocapsae TaxID=34508 RepID=A0A4U5PK01_STECR|nr:hypothetical protein L596_010914 [Steinernema carpocapsae]
MLKRLLVLAFLCLLATCLDVDNCQTKCFIDREPRCEASLEESNIVESSGIYLIGESLAELKCNFSSHNNNVKVSWHYRPKYADSWKHVKCSQTEQKNNCDLDREPSFSSLSLCRVKISTLSQEGFYKCRGEMSDGVSKRTERFESEEGDIRVVGIETIDTGDVIVLRHGEPGLIKLKVCANPQPEIFWLSGHTALRSDESKGRLSASSVHHWYQPLRRGPSEPSRVHSYCYKTHILISSVEKADEHIKAVIRAGEETKTVSFDLRVSGFLQAKSGNRALGALFLALIVSCLSLVYILNK